MKIIYDVGSNNGDDIPYYLLKSDLVVAIEANPALASVIEQRFPAELSSSRLIIENCVVTVEQADGILPFYIHRDNHVLSQLGMPTAEQISDFDKVDLPARRLIEIIEQHGAPYYVKIDVEGYDQELLGALFSAGVFPPYLSAESHFIEVFASLVANGRYDAFKLVDGRSVASVYASHPIETNDGRATYSFPYHSAGPFGNDIPGDWETAAAFLHSLAKADLGWKDIHVSRVDEPGSRSVGAPADRSSAAPTDRSIVSRARRFCRRLLKARHETRA